MTYGLRQIAIDAIQGRLEISEPELAKERIKVCEECPNFKKLSRQCNMCNCFMDAKTKFLHSGCPINKW